MVLAVSLLCFWTAEGWAVTLSGRVVDVTGKGLAGVQVELSPVSGSGPHHIVKTNPDGRYSFESVPEGDYYAEASLKGFLNCRYHPVSIRKSDSEQLGSSELDFTLPIDWANVIFLKVSEPEPD